MVGGEGGGVRWREEAQALPHKWQLSYILHQQLIDSWCIRMLIIDNQLHPFCVIGGILRARRGDVCVSLPLLKFIQ